MTLQEVFDRMDKAVDTLERMAVEADAKEHTTSYHDAQFYYDRARALRQKAEGIKVARGYLEDYRKFTGE